jgi:Heterokaryon incompatibility protein (HET)
MHCASTRNLIEHGQQVLLMRDVFSKARQVLVWLGPESKDDCKAFDFALWVQTESSALVSDSDNNYLALSDDDYENILSSGLPPEAVESIISERQIGPPWEQFAHLFTRPWFQRIWVI